MTQDLSAVKRYLQAREDIAFAYLFGSRARATPNPLSDVDIAVYLTRGPFSQKRMEILGHLTDILHTDHLDLVILNTASESLKARVVKDRAILADNTPFMRHRFESLTMRAYMDFSKMENRILERRYLRGIQKQ